MGANNSVVVVDWWSRYDEVERCRRGRLDQVSLLRHWIGVTILRDETTAEGMVVEIGSRFWSLKLRKVD